jgi:predicted TPR repeat methyltransferase
MEMIAQTYQSRDFWRQENLTYTKPHFRLEKSARLVNSLAAGKACDLLDVGCGPAALMQLLQPNIRYHGIDIAIHRPLSNLVETNFVEHPIEFRDKKFDFVVAQGVFEYVGAVQEQKMAEIDILLKSGGIFVVSYVNFNHRNRNIYWLYNNVQFFGAFYRSVSQTFKILRYFPTSHRWHHDEPRDRIMWALQKHVNVNIPVLSRMFGVEYFFVCTKK